MEMAAVAVIGTYPVCNEFPGHYILKDGTMG